MSKTVDWSGLVGRLVRARGYSHSVGYETIDLYPSVEAYDKNKKIDERATVDAQGANWRSWRLLSPEERAQPVQIWKDDVWTVVGVDVDKDGSLRLVKLASPVAQTGWTPHFYRLEVVGG
jgi:hypothetical protein